MYFQVNNGRMGDTFPLTLKALDDRVCNEKSDVCLGSFMQEKGRLCRYVSRNQNANPYMYLGNRLYHQLRSAMKHDVSIAYSFIEKEKIDPKIKFSNAKLILKNDHADRSLDRSKKRENHILLEAEPQSGKTLAGLLLISHLRSLIGEKNLEFDESNFDTSVSVTLETDSELQKLCEFRSRQEKINLEFRADLSDLMNFKKRQEKSAIDFVAEMKDLQEKQGIQIEKLRELMKTQEKENKVINDLKDSKINALQIELEKCKDMCSKQKSELKQLQEIMSLRYFQINNDLKNKVDRHTNQDINKNSTNTTENLLQEIEKYKQMCSKQDIEIHQLKEDFDNFKIFDWFRQECQTDEDQRRLEVLKKSTFSNIMEKFKDIIFTSTTKDSTIDIFKGNDNTRITENFDGSKIRKRRFSSAIPSTSNAGKSELPFQLFYLSVLMLFCHYHFLGRHCIR